MDFTLKYSNIPNSIYSISQSQEMKAVQRLIPKNKLEPKDAETLRKGLSRSRSIPAFLLAGIACGVNYYFQSVVNSVENSRQKSLIDRVSQQQRGSNFHQEFDHTKVEDWEGKRVTIDGTLKEGRFLVKRRRGEEQGYIVLAPLVVQRDRIAAPKKRIERKFVLNIGWIPKKNKHLFKSTTAYDVIGEKEYEDRTEAVELQKVDGLTRDPVFINFYWPIATLDVMIRRGENEDPINGLKNWNEQKLFRFIDLTALSRLFRIANSEEGSRVYLERMMQEGDEHDVVPIPATKETVIEDFKERIEMNNRTKAFNVGVFNTCAFVVASFAAFL